MPRKPTFKRVLESPSPDPNGLQWCEDGLWIADQGTDRVSLVSLPDGKLLRSFDTEGENLSSIAYGDDSLWLASNGSPLHRDRKPTDTGISRIIRADPETGRTLDEFPIPGGGGAHGIEWIPHGIWMTTLRSQTLTLVDLQSHDEKRPIPVPETRAHGLAADGRAIWCVHTSARIIVKLDAETGGELDRITVPAEEFEPHGLTLVDGRLWSCDQATGYIHEIAP